MTDSEARLAKRLYNQMVQISADQTSLDMFKGFGMALAFLYEEVTGLKANNIKPKELMQWASNMPIPPTRQ